MKTICKLFLISFLCLAFFSCSADLGIGEMSTGFTFVAPKSTSEMQLISRNPGEPGILLTADLINVDTNEVVDSFSTKCVPDELVSVKLKGIRGNSVYVDLKFTDPKIKDLVWACGKSETFLLKNRENLIDINLEYKGLGIYIERNPFTITALKDGNPAISDTVFSPTSPVVIELGNWDLFNMLNESPESQSVYVLLNGKTVDKNVIKTPVFADGKAEFNMGNYQILPGKNTLQLKIFLAGSTFFTNEIELNIQG